MKTKAGKMSGKSNSMEHKCPLCPFTTKFLCNYKRHAKPHLNEKPFKCQQCPYTSNLKINLNRHLNNVHLLGSTSISSRPFPCSHPGCSYAAKDKPTLVSHVKIHSGEKSFVCSYPDCNFSAHAKISLIRHNRTHTGEKPFTCQFESCSYAAAQQGDLVRHMRIHTKERPFKCPQPNCEYTATHGHDVKRHQLTHSPKEGEERPLFQCPLCVYSTEKKGDLSQHIKNRHSLEKPFACSMEACEYRCKHKQSLLAHLKTHGKERQYKCELCPFRGKTRQVVRNHLKNVHSDARPFKCTELSCHSGFKRKAHLRRHLLTHGGDEKYSCSFPDCDFKGFRETTVKQHELEAHETKKRIKCEFCDFLTREKAMLIQHVRTHTKETPYICTSEACEYRAKQPGALRRHQKLKHPQMFNQNST